MSSTESSVACRYSSERFLRTSSSSSLKLVSSTAGLRWIVRGVVHRRSAMVSRLASWFGSCTGVLADQLGEAAAALELGADAFALRGKDARRGGFALQQRLVQEARGEAEVVGRGAEVDRAAEELGVGLRIAGLGLRHG